MLNTHKGRSPKTAEDQPGLGIKHNKSILSLTKQAGFPKAMPKYHSQFPGFFHSLWSLVEKIKECGNISDAHLDTFDARKTNPATSDWLKQLNE